MTSCVSLRFSRTISLNRFRPRDPVARRHFDTQRDEPVAVTLDRVTVRNAAMTLHPYVVDRAVVSELSPPPAVVFPVERGVAIGERETIVDALEVRDVVAGQGQADQWETRPVPRASSDLSCCAQAAASPTTASTAHQTPLPPDSIAAHLTPVGTSRARPASDSGGQWRSWRGGIRAWSGGSWHRAPPAHHDTPLSKETLGRRTSKVPGRLPLTRHLRGEAAPRDGDV